jgi:hypothetical protein
MSKAVEIICTACGAEALLGREPRYDGFRKVGEILRCMACGHVYENEEQVPFKQDAAPRLFTEADRTPRVELFSEAERTRSCRLCRHYVLNPFTQRCGLHRRFVEATDCCDDFEPPSDGETGAPETPDNLQQRLDSLDT